MKTDDFQETSGESRRCNLVVIGLACLACDSACRLRLRPVLVLLLAVLSALDSVPRAQGAAPAVERDGVHRRL